MHGNAFSDDAERHKADASTQWLRSDVFVPESDSVRIADIIDKTLGFEDERLSRHSLLRIARHLIANGHSETSIVHKADGLWGDIDSVRVGDTLELLSGDSWLLEGSNGRSYVSKSVKIVVQLVGPRGYCQARCPSSCNFGRVELANCLFDNLQYDVQGGQ